MVGVWSRIACSLLGLALLLSGAGQVVAEEGPLRLVVVAVPGERTVTPFLLDLVEVRLANAGGLTLVERSHVADVLRERALGFVLGAEAAAELGALLRADALLLLTAGGPVQAAVPIRFRLLDARSGLKRADGTAILGSAAGEHDRVASTVAGRTLRGLAGTRADGDTVPVGVVGFHTENVSRRFDWVAAVLAAGLEQRLVGREDLVVLERERLQALVDEDRVTNSLPTALRGSAVLVGGTLRVVSGGGAPTVHLTLDSRRGAETLGTTELQAPLDDVPALAARAADAVAALAGSSDRALPMSTDEEVELLLDEAGVRRRMGDRERALRLLEGAHALAPDRLDVVFQLLGHGTKAFQHELTQGRPRTKESLEAYYARTVPAVFRRIALAEQVVANHLPHGLHAHHRQFGWGDPRRSYLVPGALQLFGLPRLHGGPAGAGPDVRASLAEDLSRLLARYRRVVRGENDHVMASILAEAAKTFPELVEAEQDPLVFAIGVREDAAQLMRRIALPEGPTGLRCGAELLAGERGAEMLRALLDHPDPLVRFTGLCAWARNAEDDVQGDVRARAALALLRDELIDEVPSGRSYPWFRRYVDEVARLLSDEDERAGVRAEFLGERPATSPAPSLPPAPRFRLVEAAPFDASFEGLRLVDEEGVLAVVGTMGGGTDASLVLQRLERDALDVVATQSFPLGRPPPSGAVAVAARADGSVFVGQADVGVVHFPPTGPGRVLRPAADGAKPPIRALAAFGGKVYALVGGPHTATGLVELDPTSGGERLLLTSRSLKPMSVLDGRPLRALCALANGKGLLIEVGPLRVPPAGDPRGLRDASTYYRYDPATGRADGLLRSTRLGFLGEAGHISLRRVGTRALVEALPLVLDLDLETGEYEVLYKVSVTKAVGRIPSRWQGRDWPPPLSLAGPDLLCKVRGKQVVFVEGEASSVPLWTRVARPDPRAPPPAIRDALARPDGALLLGPHRLRRLVRVRDP